MTFGNVSAIGFGTYDAGVRALASLVLCAEDETVAVLSRVLHVDIRVEVSRKAQSVLTSPSGRRSDAVVVDCEDEVSALPLIAHFRQYPRSAMRRDCAGQKPGACEARCLLTALQLSPLQTGLSRRALGTGRVGIRLLVGTDVYRERIRMCPTARP